MKSHEQSSLTCISFRVPYKAQSIVLIQLIALMQLFGTSLLPGNKYLFKVNNEDTGLMSVDFVLVSLTSLMTQVLVI